MARATWSGQISFGLVNVPVKLFTAVRSHDVRFHQLHETTRARVRRKRVDAKTGEEVPTDEVVKGWEVDGGQYVVVDPADIGGVATDDVEVTDRELDMAEQLIGSLTTDFEPEDYRDEHHERVMEFLRAEAEGEDVTVEAPAEEEAEVIDLMDALEASLGRSSGDRGTDRALDDMTKRELYELAQETDVPGRSDMTEDELVAALSERELAAS